MIPEAILNEYNSVVKSNPKAWIGFNAAINKYCVYIFDISFTKSLLIVKIEL